MTETKNKKDRVFRLVQKFLKNPPVIIWGSGATIPYGLPGMNDLKKCLKGKLDISKNTNLETELGKIRNIEIVEKVKQIIRDEIVKRDLICLKKSIKNQNYFNPIVNMIKKFYDAHPRKIDVITTNYDCVLEYALSKSNYSFTDGFTGKTLASFQEDNFKTKNCINLIKVHGSLNWAFDTEDNLFYLSDRSNFDLKYAMILPAKESKYYEALIKEPYRDLIGKSDSVIKQANSFFVVGFGFNDEHLTPKIDSRIKEEIPIVIITKEATDSCKKKLKNAEKYCLFQKNGQGTKVTYKDANNIKEESCFKDSYWTLNQFMKEVL